VESEPLDGCFKGFQVADAKLDLDLNRLHGTSLYRFHICPASSATIWHQRLYSPRLREEKNVPNFEKSIHQDSIVERGRDRHSIHRRPHTAR
jgi:hypothetical protein